MKLSEWVWQLSCDSLRQAEVTNTPSELVTLTFYSNICCMENQKTFVHTLVKILPCPKSLSNALYNEKHYTFISMAGYMTSFKMTTIKCLTF